MGYRLNQLGDRLFHLRLVQSARNSFTMYTLFLANKRLDSVAMVYFLCLKSKRLLSSRSNRMNRSRQRQNEWLIIRSQLLPLMLDRQNFGQNGRLPALRKQQTESTLLQISLICQVVSEWSSSWLSHLAKWRTEDRRRWSTYNRSTSTSLPSAGLKQQLDHCQLLW